MGALGKLPSLVTLASTLDALSIAVTGCGAPIGSQRYAPDRCGDPPFFVGDVLPRLCYVCQSKRDVAIHTLTSGAE